MGKIKNLLIEAMETPIIDVCAECEGTGTVEFEVARPQSFSRDIGEIDVEEETCEACDGSGELERLCDCGEVVTLIMGEKSLVCEECANDR